MNTSLRIKIKAQNLKLLPQKAIFWEEESTLIICDLQPGKNSLKKDGFALSQNGTEKKFTRITQLIRDNHVERIIFTGDLYHGKETEEWRMFTQWRKTHDNVRMDVVAGSDSSTYSHYRNNSINVTSNELTVTPFTFCNHPQETISFEKYFIAGHIHPVFNVQGLHSDSTHLPCFCFGRAQAILPGFGNYTGGSEIRRKSGDQIYLVVDNSVVEVK